MDEVEISEIARSLQHICRSLINYCPWAQVFTILLASFAQDASTGARIVIITFAKPLLIPENARSLERQVFRKNTRAQFVSYIRIRKHYVHIPHLVLGFVELAAHFCIVWMLDSILVAGTSPLLTLHTLWDIYLIYGLILSCSTLAMGVYNALLTESTANMLLRTLVSYFLLGMLGFVSIRLVFPSFVPGQVVLFWSIISSFIVTVLIRMVFATTFDMRRLRRKVLVFGAGKKAREILDSLNEGGFLDVELVGFVHTGSGLIEIPEDKIVREPEDWLGYLRANKISELVVAQDERRRSEGADFPLNDFLFSKLRGVDVTEVVSFIERGQTKLELSLLDTSWMLFSDGFKYSKSRDYSKRIFDLLVSFSLLIVAAPLMIPTALAVFLETGRPIFYHQERVGYNGRRFRIYKFRSMRQDAEKGGKAIWAQKNDSRITKVGAFIRNTRLDELPQLLNVIRGEMSFVGPRPERPEFVDELSQKIPYYDLRHTVKPGLMGWAQLKYPYGASEEDAKNKLEYDLYYTKNHSLMMDILIMIQTVEVVLLGKGVH